MKKGFETASLVLFSLGVFLIVLMIFFTRTTGNYWGDINVPKGSTEPFAQWAFVCFVLSFVSLCASEIESYFNKR